MSSFFLAALQGFGLGAGLLIAIGAQNAFILRQGLLRRHVTPVVAVCAIFDAALIALGVGGVGALVAANPALTRWVAYAGAAFLFLYGARALRRAIITKGMVPDETDAATGSMRTAVITALALSVLNPHVYLDTVVLVGGIAGQYPPSERLWFGFGAVLASATWFSALGYGARLLTPIFKTALAWRILDLAIAAIMWAIAISLIRLAQA